MKLKFSWRTKNLGKAVLVFLSLGLFVLVNFILSFFPLRLDLTKNHIWTISKATKDILGNLDGVVNVKVFLSRELPNRLLPARQNLKDVLKEYEQLSSGKLQVSFIDPKDDLKKEREAASLGIPKVRFSSVERNKLAVSSGYFGLSFSFGKKKETIPLIDPDSNLEYELSSRIYKLTRKKIPQIALSQGHGEKQITLARELLSQEFRVVDEKIASGSRAEISPNYAVLIVAGPTAPFGKKEKEALAQYLKKGGNVIFALEGVEVGNGLRTAPAEHNLFSFLGDYGLVLNKNLVLSALSETASFRSNFGFFIASYPFWVKIEKAGFSSKRPALGSLQTAVFPWVSSIKIKSAPAVENYALIKSSSRSWLMKEKFNLDPQGLFQPKKGELGEKILAAEADLKKGGKIILLGDSDFLTDNFLQRFKSDAVLFLNLVDFLAGGGKLSGIRAKQNFLLPLRAVADQAKDPIKYGNTFLPALLVAGIGFLRLYKRNRRNERFS